MSFYMIAKIGLLLKGSKRDAGVGSIKKAGSRPLLQFEWMVARVSSDCNKNGRFILQIVMFPFPGII